MIRVGPRGPVIPDKLGAAEGARQRSADYDAGYHAGYKAGANAEVARLKAALAGSRVFWEVREEIFGKETQTRRPR